MEHGTALVATIAVGLTVAFLGGLVARLVRLPPIVGYLLAGVAIGPFTPGFVGDQDVALELAEIGVVLLMFGVGLHFSIRDLLEVRRVAIPGALGQITVATGLGVAVGLAIGAETEEALILGVAVSVASTVVLLRALQQRGQVRDPAGRIAIGWLLVEDLFTVMVLVVLPVIAQDGAAGNPGWKDALAHLGLALGKTALLGVVTLVAGARLIPWLFEHVERTGNRELFTLAIMATALGVAFASAEIFGLSLALGAFLAGVMLTGSRLTDRITHDLLPLTDVFGVLFFVAVGMLLDPGVLVREPVALLAVVAIVVVGKSLAAVAITKLLREPAQVGGIVAAGLAQVGEFSFIVVTAGLELGIVSDETLQLVVAAALISISVNPLMFRLSDAVVRRSTVRA
ncbi:MAG TPA: cation:proton antiporter [Actinomycetota bacterium]